MLEPKIELHLQNEKIKENFLKFKSSNISEEEKEEEFEINAKNKNSSDSRTESQIDENNIFYQNIACKYLFPEFNFFFCNEKYIKEQIPEGNNYKINSRNYINKKNLNSESKIDNLDMNRINNILNDIEKLQKKLKNKFDIFENNFFNLNELSKTQFGVFDLNSSYVNNNFNSKYFFIILNMVIIENNILLAKINEFEKNQKEKEKKDKIEDHKEEEITNQKKKFVTRPGDWLCLYCNNLNFAFRNSCNRCRFSKYYFY